MTSKIHILGRSRAVLGRSWSDFLSSSFSHRFFDRFWSRKGCPKGGQREAKIVQNRIQNESKFKTIFKRQKIALQDRLGGLLGRSWDPRTPTFLHTRVRRCPFDVFDAKRRPRAIRERKMTKNDPKMPPKTTPGRLQNDPFWRTIFGPIFGRILMRKKRPKGHPP